MATYYHFSQLDPGNWQPGSLCHTPEREQNFYWRRVFARASYEQNVAEARSKLSANNNPTPAEADSLVHTLAAKDYLVTCIRELLFEMVRQEVASELPSRSNCLFLVECDADLAACAKRYGFDKTGRTILEIETLEGSSVFRARAALLDTTVITEDIVSAAYQYWKGVSRETPSDEVEILMTGPFRIRNILQSGTGPCLTIEGRGFAELLSE